MFSPPQEVGDPHPPRLGNPGSVTTEVAVQKLADIFKTWLNTYRLKKTSFHPLTPHLTKVCMSGTASRWGRRRQLWRRRGWWRGQSSMCHVFQPYQPSYPRLWLPPSSQQKQWHLKIEEKTIRNAEPILDGMFVMVNNTSAMFPMNRNICN